MTAARAEEIPAHLPLWRMIAGFGVIAILVLALFVAGSVYLENFRLDRYMRSLAVDPASVTLSEAEITSRILDRAHSLGLPLHASDVTVTRANGRPHIHIDKYTTETVIGRMDLRLPAASSR
ncbi:MAG TPA: hypothetical protein VN519_02105 [Bryobacteraceae bacterium]|nr:hypothetical protein [Bryobacteraceae bacterium]